MIRRPTIVTYPDHRLTNRCAPFPVEQLTADETMGEWVSVFTNTIEALPKMGAYAVAANQMGHTLRWLAVAHHRDLDVPKHGLILVNPEVVTQSEDEVASMEGCLSLPGIRVNVRRPKTIRVRYTCGYTAQEREKTFSGLTARVILHEIDHLDGMLSIDRTTEAERTRVSPALQAMRQS